MDAENEFLAQTDLSRRNMIALMGGAAAGTAMGLGASSATAADNSSPSDLTWLPAWRIREMIVARQVSALDVTEHFLARTAKLDPKFHMYEWIDPAGAREQARAADRALADGINPGLLHGVPTAVKNHVGLKGAIHGGNTYEADSVTSERLKKAGAVIFGITIAPGMGIYEGQALETHPCNPWDPARVPGSSSAGSAAAVAAGCVPFSIGSDGGGSTRNPAALCGLVGLHPTQGRVASYNYGDKTASFGGTIGPITRDARDAALVMQVIAGPDGRAMVSSILGPAPDYLAGLRQSVKGLRIAYMDHMGFGDQFAVAETTRVRDTVRQAAETFRALGASVTTVRGTWEDPRPYSSIINSAMSGQKLPTGDSSPAEINAAFAKREEYRAGFAKLLSEHDVLILPTAAFIAPELGPWNTGMNARGMVGMIQYTRFYTANTLMFNFLQMPALAVPCGFVDGMPVSMQIAGPADSDVRLLALANAYLERFPANRHPHLD